MLPSVRFEAGGRAPCKAFDLRDPEHVADLEAALAAADLGGA
jgi:hypothetical protein